jgi:hypothetical protein
MMVFLVGMESGEGLSGAEALDTFGTLDDGRGQLVDRRVLPAYEQQRASVWRPMWRRSPANRDAQSAVKSLS